VAGWNPLLSDLEADSAGTCGMSGLHAFDDMTRDDAWQFLVIGRSLKRMAFLSSVTIRDPRLAEEIAKLVLRRLAGNRQQSA